MLKRNQWKQVFLGAVAGVVLLGAGGVGAEQKWIVGAKMVRTLSHTSAYGQCMIRTDKKISDYIASCGAPGNTWVTFSCDGTYNSKDAGQRKFESAQLAMALGYRMDFSVDNTKKHNGYCFVQDVRIFK